MIQKIETQHAKTSNKMSAKSHKSTHTRVKIPHIPLDMPGRYSTGHVMAVTGWSHSTLYNRIKEGKFPPPCKSGSLNFWDTATVRAALGL